MALQINEYVGNGNITVVNEERTAKTAPKAPKKPAVSKKGGSKK